DALANGSSIAFLAEHPDGSCLFGADAFAPVLLESLQRRGAAKTKVDAFKLAHHGSRRNTSIALLQHLECSRFLISTNGKRFRHPNPDTIARVIQHGGKNPDLYFNYRTTFTSPFETGKLTGAPKYTTTYSADEKTGLVIELA